ncbi:hypothetical protein CONCODRAFT_169204 [Conidiobolus coronatus NRRL 28638]|uniref:Uncharacterized protein n=1 Tax=Conidiobolus coronatus (strain ATCC 28846 / CBS 209.66 / NRRL 28638) TaxID=796925 RepID=A0A137NSB1_CONC2|nr:hypothetical protein CONCODRAFT_169204 [Conidiobolus coronatus NRRL 28638]|eukprot:KXN65626.1 hypothetical protein CONCODRAFT_169204 [Conidiobolus coronatus NRRL 28638]
MLADQNTLITEYRIEKDNEFDQWRIQSELGESLYFKPGSKDSSYLSNASAGQIGKVSLKSFWKGSYVIKVRTQDNPIKLRWKMKTTTSGYKVTGNTKVKGFENINWLVERSDDDCQLILKPNKVYYNYENYNGVDEEFYLAKFIKSSSLKGMEIGFLYISNDLPRDIKLVILLSFCFTASQMKVQAVDDVIESISLNSI